MTFGTAISTCLRKYATFSGRATRPEFWWFVVFNAIVSTVGEVLDAALGLTWSAHASVGVISVVCRLALLLPLLAVGARRLHDVGRSGWWLLLALVPCLGVIALVVMWAQPGDARPNAFDAAPTP